VSELTWIMFMGSLSGLASILGQSVAASAIGLLRMPAKEPAMMTGTPQVAQALLHMFCGALLSLLFWLSWGLAAIVDVSWWVRGLYFGSLCWLALALPCLASATVACSVPFRTALRLAGQWLGTCLISALISAWGMERIF